MNGKELAKLISDIIDLKIKLALHEAGIEARTPKYRVVSRSTVVDLILVREKLLASYFNDYEIKSDE